ncbi:K(+)-transporting ATPase subunit F [Streptomyces sp. NBC_01214]|nr:K(+)-transporting ATPase subunit F [Streptomyces sp. NBC_01214]MCX4803294.1 K(+)-transporting ATPase subunit F [Streptomyces sp. NBC_01214]
MPDQYEEEKLLMNAENVVGLLIALALLGYLVVALIKPEKF